MTHKTNIPARRYLFLGPMRDGAWDGPPPASGDLEYVLTFHNLRAAIRAGATDDLYRTLFNRFRPLSGGTGAKGDPVVLHPTHYYGHIVQRNILATQPDNAGVLAQMDIWGTDVIVRVRGDEKDYFTPRPGSSVYDPDTGALVFRRTLSGKNICWQHDQGRAKRHVLGAG